MRQQGDTHTYRMEQMEEAVASVRDSRAANNLYRQAMVEAADYEGLAEMAVMAHPERAGHYAVLATMKYTKAAALKAR